MVVCHDRWLSFTLVVRLDGILQLFRVAVGGGGGVDCRARDLPVVVPKVAAVLAVFVVINAGVVVLVIADILERTRRF